MGHWVNDRRHSTERIAKKVESNVAHSSKEKQTVIGDVVDYVDFERRWHSDKS